MAFLSTTNAPGTRAYTSVVCENNWFEERARIESGERVYIGCMEGAYLRPEDPDLSIAPDYRNPEVPADGRLVMPHRSWRSRTTFDSSRQGADDGFRIYSSLSGDDYCPIEKRGNSQLDDLRKTRSATTAPMATTARIANREKNAMFEQSRICDGKTGYGCVVPRHRTVHTNDFQTCHRNDFTGEKPDPAFPDGRGTAAIPIYAP